MTKATMKREVTDRVAVVDNDVEVWQRSEDRAGQQCFAALPGWRYGAGNAGTQHQLSQ